MQSGGFTDKAKTALMLAKKAAGRMYAGYIGTEHILVGLLKEKTGVAARVLEENGADEEKIMEMIKELIVPEITISVKEREGYSPRAQEVLEEAHSPDERFDAENTGIDNISLAISKSEEYVALCPLITRGMAVKKL